MRDERELFIPLAELGPIEITNHGDPHPRQMCPKCGHSWESPASTDAYDPYRDETTRAPRTPEES